MAALLSNAFGRKNLLGGSKSSAEAASKTPSPAASDLGSNLGGDSGGYFRSRSNTNEPVIRSRPGTSDGPAPSIAPPRSRPGTSDGPTSMPRSRPGTSDGPTIVAPPRSRSNTNEAGYNNGAAYPAGNPLNQPLWSPSQANRSAAYHVQDPVSMHLLMENALDDSRSYEVLEPDAVSMARNELDSIAGRVEATQRKLALETKVRDAAKSMNQIEKIEEANQAALRCEALQDELFKLQREEQQCQKRLLEHTAGVLQMTHKGYLRDQPEMTNGATFEQAHLYEPSMLLDALEGGNKLSDEQQDMITNIQFKVEDFNRRIRDLLREFNAPARDIPPPVRSDGDPERVIETALDQINSLDQCFATVARLQSSQKREHQREQASLREQLREHTATKGRADEAARSVGEMNQNLYRTLTSGGRKVGLSAPPDTGSLPGQMQYFEFVQQSIQDQTDNLARYDSAMRGLWDEMATPDDGEFSVGQLTAMIQEMNMKYSSLQEQKNVLTRQIQQQREMNESGGKDGEIADLKEQLERAQADLDRTEQEMDTQIEKLSSTIDDLETAKAAMSAENDADKAALTEELAASKAAHTKDVAEAKTSHDKVLADTRTGLEKDLGAEKQARATAEAAAQKAQQQLTEANNLMEVNTLAIKADLEAKTAAAEKAETDLHELEGEVARLQTELTISKAELDGAYGTRAERAAERDPELQARVKELESELQETITDYEAMTKATIEHEREKDEIETQMDALRDKVESLENELAEERVGSMGGKGGDGGGAGGGGTSAGATSAAVLRTEFKKMMKDAREQHSKALKAEKDERRKLEAQIRQLKRDALPSRGKTSTDG